MISDIAENRFFPDCSGVVTMRVFVTVNLSIEHFEMSVIIIIIITLDFAQPSYFSTDQSS